MEGFFLLIFTVLTHCGSNLDWFWVIQDITIISSCANSFFFLWSNAWKEPTYKRKSLLRLTTWRDNLPWLVAGAKNVQVGLCYNTSRPAPTNLFSLVSSRGSTSSKIAPPFMANYSNTWAHGKHFTLKSQLPMYDKCCGFLTVHLKEIQRFLCNLVGQFSTITRGNEY